MTFDKNNVQHLQDALKNAIAMQDREEIVMLRDKIREIQQQQK